MSDAFVNIGAAAVGVAEQFDVGAAEGLQRLEASMAWKRYCRDLLDQTETPIEEKLLEAVLNRCDRTSPPHIKVQHRIGLYRADFTINGLVVECDGHEWHDRTPEQALRDRRRDRWMLRRGWPVYRFTGTEIMRDAPGCAYEIEMFLQGIDI